jgi:excisionase family DNA binding protein
MQYTVDVVGRLLRVSEVAFALGVSPHTIRVWMSQGRISFIKLGRASRISEHELSRLIANGFKLSRE